MKQIIWRFDDLCFDKNSEFYLPPAKIKKIADIFHKNGQHANFSYIIRNEDIFSKEAINCLNFLTKNGHQILAHGGPHTNWQKLTEQEIKNAIKNMRETLNLLKIECDTFVFPGLKSKHLAYEILKKHGFNKITKDTRVKGLSKIIDTYYSRKYKLKFVKSHNWTTFTKNRSLKPITSFYNILNVNAKQIYVMDHLWLYKNQQLGDFKYFIDSISKINKLNKINDVDR